VRTPAAAIVHVRVTPRSSRSEVSSYEDGVLSVRVTAPPVEGEANKAVIELVSGLLGIPKSRIEVKSGASGRRKSLVIAGMTQQELDERMAGHSSL